MLESTKVFKEDYNRFRTAPVFRKEKKRSLRIVLDTLMACVNLQKLLQENLVS
jgi:hypothetical protein